MRRAWEARASGGDSDPELRPALERVARLSIFFAHQSVGANLLDGLQALAGQSEIPLRIAETAAASGVGPATLGHTLVAENGKPLEKIRIFEQAVGTQPAGLDVAMLKFCYLDIDARTDVPALFAQYRAMADRLRAAHPAMAIVHVTAPLTDVRSGPRAFVQRLLGRAPYGTVENLRREEYNALLREAYRGREPVFDLARAESMQSNGAPATVQWMGRRVPIMAPENTDDGGHLSAAGRLRAARALVSVLAAAPGRPASGAAQAR